MRTFDEVFNIVVETNASEEAFNKEECRTLFDLLHAIPEGSRVVELGVQFGRSMTVMGLVALDRGLQVVGVDNWQEEISAQAKKNIEKQIDTYAMPVELWSMSSMDATYRYKENINLIHIDADHSYEAVLADCVEWLPKVIVGGYACFDDYGHNSLPGVFKAVTEYMEDIELHTWKFVGRYGNKLGVFQRETV